MNPTLSERVAIYEIANLTMKLKNDEITDEQFELLAVKAIRNINQK